MKMTISDFPSEVMSAEIAIFRIAWSVCQGSEEEQRTYLFVQKQRSTRPHYRSFSWFSMSSEFSWVHPSAVQAVNSGALSHPWVLITVVGEDLGNKQKS